MRGSRSSRTSSAAAHDDLALRDNENELLRTSLDLAMAENAALTERLAKSDVARHSTGSQLEYLQTALATAETECTRLFNEARDSPDGSQHAD